MKLNSLQSLLATVLGAGLIAAPTVEAKSVLITDATIHTMSAQGTLTDADILVVDGVIQVVGKDLDAKADQTIDAKGKIVTPGIFALANHVGLVELDSLEQTADMSTKNEDLGAGFRVHKAFNPKSTLIPNNRAQGVTRTLLAPRNGTSLFAGTGAVMSLDGDFDAVIHEDTAMFAVYGESGSNMAGGSRASALHYLDTAFSEAKEYQQNQAAIESGEYREMSFSADDLVALAPVIAGEIPLVISVNRTSDMLALIELAKEHGVRLVFNSAAEAWMIADKLAATNVAVLIDPTDNIPSSFEALGKRFENAAMLNKAGVEVMFLGQGFLATHNAHSVRHSAGTAVSYGLPYDVAMKALSTTPAKVFGLNDFGQIKAGMNAELVIWSGDPLELMTVAEGVMIDGEMTSLVKRSDRLRDRYKDLDSDKNTFYRK